MLDDLDELKCPASNLRFRRFLAPLADELTHVAAGDELLHDAHVAVLVLGERMRIGDVLAVLGAQHLQVVFVEGFVGNLKILGVANVRVWLGQLSLHREQFQRILFTR